MIIVALDSRGAGIYAFICMDIPHGSKKGEKKKVSQCLTDREVRRLDS